MRRLIAPLLFGLLGCGILVGLGVWQVQRLAWKQAILAEITSRIDAAPVSLRQNPDPVQDSYMPVEVAGRTTAEELLVLASRKQIGAGYRVIRVFETGGRRVLLDLGFVPEEFVSQPRPAQALTVRGNLHWPKEVDSFTPEPDSGRGLWFARDVPRMAAALETEPVLIVARETDPALPQVTPLAADTAGIPNDHLQYALTWFSLAFVWLGMTALLVRRITRRNG